MSAREWIEKKKRGGALTPAEIRSFVGGYLQNKIPEYQMAAFLMAVWFQGLDEDEMLALTESMMQSGKILDLTEVQGPKIDKHSTGGIGDKVSLPLMGIALACGLKVPMLSGRGLGHTGGTLDKLESIPGYSTQFTSKRYMKLLEEVGGTIVGQSEDLVPADRELYALRDVTATVDSVPLIVASILSKKFAAGIDGVVLDVKVGSGAFMRDLPSAEELARNLTRVAHAFQKEIAVVFTRMDEPLGEAVGNAIEVRESVDLLRGTGPKDLLEVTSTLTARMLQLGGLAVNATEAMQSVQTVIENGEALKAFQGFVEAHGGRLDWDAQDLGLTLAPHSTDVVAEQEAVLVAVDGYEVGMAVVTLGGGRQAKGDTIDPRVGLLWKVRIGDRVQRGQVLAEVFTDDRQAARSCGQRISQALSWSQEPIPVPPVVLGDFQSAE